MGETYYEVLGVSTDATAEEIERAYRERVLETHPDHNDEPDAAAQFSAVTTAADVLTDESERARYDELGHETYCGDGAGGVTNDDGPGSAGTDRDWTDEEWWKSSSDDQTNTGPSHHARQRARRQGRSTSHEGWWFSGDPFEGVEFGRTSDDSRTSSRGATTGFGPRTTTHGSHSSGPTQGFTGGTDDGFAGYAVHQWDDDVDPGEPFRSIRNRTLFFGVGLALCYPGFVYATVAPSLPWLANVLVGFCTFVLIGYLLTIPRIALGTFGGWSVVASVAVLLTPSITPFSAVGLAVFAGFWVPFGYAVGIWWVLRV